MSKGRYAKTGGRKGMPAYRTPSAFRYRHYKDVGKIKSQERAKRT